MDRSNERWLPIVGHEDRYEVSDQGRVRSLGYTGIDRRGRRVNRKGKTLKPVVNTNGRLQVFLCRNGKQKQVQVHRLVLEAFVGPAPEGMECCHWDDDPTNNSLRNIRWASRSDNMYDRVRNGRDHNTRKTHCIRGHEFTADNTYVSPSRPTERTCRACKAIRDRRRKEQMKEKRQSAA